MLRFAIPLALAVGASHAALGQESISNLNKRAWCENVGWTNWRDANGAVDGVRVLSNHLQGMVWQENTGWMNLGNGGGPYANADGASFGVNIVASGFLDGFGWSENLGWVNFGLQPHIGADAARYDANSHRFRGWAWSENAGWINLDDASAFVATVCPGDANGDGLVNFADLNAVLSAFGTTGAPGTAPGDLNEDGVVNFGDLNLVLSAFGDSCG
jgi:hypothetical protein